MKNITILILSVFILASCASFKKKHSEVKVGETKSTIIENLGSPNHKSEEAIMLSGMFRGAQQALIPILSTGSHYHEWKYERNEVVYYVWFTGKKSEHGDSWKVIGKYSHPKGAVFETLQ